MMKYSHRILLYNEYRIEELADWGIPPDKLIVLNNAINEKPHRAALKNVSQATCDQIEASTRVSSHTLLFIGRITPAKRVDLIIKLSGMIVKFFPDLRVFIIGDGSDRFKLQGLTQKMGLEKNIFFMGTINDPVELSGYMSLADFSVLPGAVGLSIVHSMICGIPFVTLKDSPHSPEIAYLRDNYNGFAASNLQEMGGWIITQFKNPSKLKTMKMNCVNMINKEVNLNHMVTQYLNGIDL
jgi:glycosyltransferase involved in cell wall biosynthesis